MEINKKIYSIEELETFFQPAANKFKELAFENGKNTYRLIEKLRSDGFEDTATLIESIKKALDEKDLLISSTMIVDLTKANSQVDLDLANKIRKTIMEMRGFDRKELKTTNSELNKFGNCAEYAIDVQKIAIDNGFSNTFVIDAAPDHGFCIAIDNNDNIIVIDAWSCNLIYSIDEFYKIADLGGMYDFKISSAFNKKNQKGHLDLKDTKVQNAMKKIQNKLDEINQASYKEENKLLINERIKKELLNIAADDFFFNKKILNLIVVQDKFKLDQKKFLDKMLEASYNGLDKNEKSYLAKFNNIYNMINLIKGQNKFIKYLKITIFQESGLKAPFDNSKLEKIYKDYSSYYRVNLGRAKSTFCFYLKSVSRAFTVEQKDRIFDIVNNHFQNYYTGPLINFDHNYDIFSDLTLGFCSKINESIDSMDKESLKSVSELVEYLYNTYKDIFSKTVPDIILELKERCSTKLEEKPCQELEAASKKVINLQKSKAT